MQLAKHDTLVEIGGYVVDPRGAAMNLAIQDEEVDLIAEMIDEVPALVNARQDPFDQGATPLHLAAEQGNLKLVKVLVDRRANIHSCVMTDGGLPLCASMIALMRAQEDPSSASCDVVRFLINAGAFIPAMAQPQADVDQGGELAKLFQFLEGERRTLPTGERHQRTGSYAGAFTDCLEARKQIAS
eukprot:5355366-Prymnesium_polylepis.1